MKNYQVSFVKANTTNNVELTRNVITSNVDKTILLAKSLGYKLFFIQSI